MKKRSLGVAAAAVLASFGILAGTAASGAVSGSTPGSTTPTQQLTTGAAAVPVRGDFDGDGRDDVFWYVEGSGTDYLWSGKAHDATNSTTIADRFDVTTLPISGSYTPIVGDFDGDGRDDVLWYSPGTGPDSVWYFTGRGTVEGKDLRINSTYQAVVSDFDATDGLGADDIFWYNNSASYLWTATATRGSFTSAAIMDPPNNAKVYKGNWRQTAVTVGAPEYEDLFFYAAGTAPDAIWAGNGNGDFTKSAITVNGTYDPIVGNFDANASGVDMTDVFWYGPGAAADFVWMNNGSSFTSQPQTVNGRYTPLVIPTREDTTQDDIFWNSQTAGDYLWATNGTNGTFAYSSMTPSAWGGTDIGTRSPITGDFNIADPTPGGSPDRMLATGSSTTCGVSQAGAAYCWGNKAYILAASGMPDYAATPTVLPGLTSGIAQIEAGTGFACALTTAGAVKCIGDGTAGQLGNGSLTASQTAVQVTGLTSGVTSIAVGDTSACAVLSDATVKCWGANWYGQLGNGTTTSSPTPVVATGVTGAAQVEISEYLGSVCASLTNGNVKCWGYNVDGQLGLGNTTSPVTTPTSVGNFSGTTDVALGSNFSCALFTNGSVKCFGNNNANQLGNGTNTNSLTGVVPTGLAGVTQIEAGGGSACAEVSGTQVKCWGYNTSGQLGIGTTTNVATPTNVTAFALGVEGISIGSTHMCATLTGGTMKCTGPSGYIGTGSSGTVTTPTTVTGGITWSTGVPVAPTGNADVLWWNSGNAAGQSEVLWYDLDSLN